MRRSMLAADIGGTFSRFALFTLDEDAAGFSLVLEAESKITLATRQAESFAALLSGLPWAGGGARIDCAAAAVPGPVEKGRCLAPNIPWPLETRSLEQALNCPASLLNDFAAQGLACLFPDILGLRSLLPGAGLAGRSAAVLGAGTGLGKAQILPPALRRREKEQENKEQGPALPEGYAAERLSLPRKALSLEALGALEARVLPSEGGHALFPFQGEEEAAFEAFARSLSGRAAVICDMVVSGYGLSLLHAFHRGARQLLPPEDISPGLSTHAPELAWLARFYGRACRNFALETLALGGVYLSGGILQHVPGLAGHPAFAEEFRRSETQSALLSMIPVRRVSNPDAGLWGSAIHGLGLLLAAPSRSL